MADKLFIRADENGEIHTWGAELTDAIEIAASAIPSDWYKYSHAKYIWNGSALVARVGWVAPVIDETVSVPAQVPADPEGE